MQHYRSVTQKLGVTAMSQKDTTETLAHHEVSELAVLARQAYDQKRTKDCLDLTRAILLIDPDNADALQIRSSIQSRMQHDLENARAILRQRQVDLGEAQQPESNDSNDTGDTELEAVPVPPPAEVLPGRGKRLAAYVLIVVAIMLAVTAFAVPSFRNTATPAQPPAPPLITAETPKPTVPQPLDPAPVPDVLPEQQSTVVPPAPPSPTPAPVARPVTPPAKLADPLPIPAAPLPAGPIPAGKLAVSSPTTVDIYKGEVYLGSAPVSLELPAGPQTLEYRHGDLRKTVTHTINSNGTTRAMITFDITVQINARPWAAVSQEGIESKDLGQTPLSGVRVPIGSMLVFRNPQFQPKRYRVTGNETGIQIVFP